MVVGEDRGEEATLSTPCVSAWNRHAGAMAPPGLGMRCGDEGPPLWVFQPANMLMGAVPSSSI